MSPAKTARAACAALVCAAGALVGMPSAAYACTPPSGSVCSDSTLNVTLTAGTLSLTAPASVSISGTLGASPSFSQQMGQVQVQDNRGSGAGWSLTALTTGNLSTGGGSPHTISLGSSNTGGPLTLVTGTITPVLPATIVGVTAGPGGSLNPTQPVAVASAIVNTGAGTYNMTPTLTLAPPANTFAGTYTTTITFTLT